MTDFLMFVLVHAVLFLATIIAVLTLVVVAVHIALPLCHAGRWLIEATRNRGSR